MENFFNTYIPKNRSKDTVICTQDEKCPFCQAGIKVGVQFQVYDIISKETSIISMPKKVYDKIMDQR